MHQIGPAVAGEPTTGAPRPSPGSLPSGTLALAQLYSAASLPASTVGGDDERALWAAEAVHRANNLAQIATSLTRFRWRNKSEMIPKVAHTEVEALVSAYGRLNDVQDLAAPLPCNDLLRQVLTALDAMFAGAGVGVGLRIEGPELFLAPDRRRALVLIASELVINAFKHGFRERTSGMVSVSLRLGDGRAELAIDDDGVGLDDPGKCQGGEGQGGKLLEGLTAILEGTITRNRSSKGGLRACVRFAGGFGKPTGVGMPERAAMK